MSTFDRKIIHIRLYKNSPIIFCNFYYNDQQINLLYIVVVKYYM